jgi:hypothetical protein
MNHFLGQNNGIVFLFRRDTNIAAGKGRVNGSGHWHIRVEGLTSLKLLNIKHLRLNTILNKIPAILNIVDRQGLKA